MALAIPTEILQICTVTKNWRQACKPWIQLGKPFLFLTLSEENVSNYIVRGVPQAKVDFVVEIAYAAEKAEIEFIQPISGSSFYSDFLTRVKGEGTFHHIAIGATKPFTVKDLYAELQVVGSHCVSFDVGNPKNPSVTAHYFDLGEGQIVELWDYHEGGEGPATLAIKNVEGLEEKKEKQK